MKLTPEKITEFGKSAALGAFTGIVFSVIFVALPGALTLFAVGVMDINWDLSWFPDAITILSSGALIGAIIATILFIKDQHIPYVETVQDFEDDSEEDLFR